MQLTGRSSAKSPSEPFLPQQNTIHTASNQSEDTVRMLLWIEGRVGHHPRASVYETQKLTFLQTGLFSVIVCCDQNYLELLADKNPRRQQTSMTADPSVLDIKMFLVLGVIGSMNARF